MSELKPCPFCGGDPSIEEIEAHAHVIAQMPDCPGYFYVECAPCDSRRFGDTRQEAIDAWNTRHQESELSVEGLQQDLGLQKMAYATRVDQLRICEQALVDANEKCAELERKLGEMTAKRDVAAQTLELAQEHKNAAQKALAEQCAHSKELQRLLEEEATAERQLGDAIKLNEAAKQDEDEFKPKFVKFRNDQCGCKYAEYELQLTSCGGEFEGDAPKLYALPPNLPALIEQVKREEREAALKPLRTAVMALASAATSNPMFACDPMYQGAYEEIDAAIRARTTGIEEGKTY